MRSEAWNELWIVVKVESGVPVAVAAYPEEREARRAEQHLRRRMHSENDETGVFEVRADARVASVDRVW